MSHPLCHVFKKELLLIPFFGWAIGKLDMIDIDRSKRTEAWNKVAEQGRRFMAQGNWVIMFPEGTRRRARAHGKVPIGCGAAGHRHRHADRADRRGLFCAPPAAQEASAPGVIDISIGQPIAVQGRKPDQS